MGVVDPGNAFEPGGPAAGDDGVQVDGADAVHPSDQQVEQQPEVIFQVKELSLMEQQAKPVLPEKLSLQGEGGGLLPAHQYHVVARLGQGGADPDHSLIIGQIIGYGAINRLWHNVCRPTDPGPFGSPRGIKRLCLSFGRTAWRFWGRQINHLGIDLLFIFSESPVGHNNFSEISK